MLVMEFRVDSPILLEALDHAPEITVRYEEQYQTDDGITLLFWADGGDFAAFEEGLDADPTVADSVRLAEPDSHCLYRVTFSEFGERVATAGAHADLDLSIREATGTREGWEVRAGVPDRDALRKYREEFESKDIRFQLKSIHEEREVESTTESRLTDAQRESLATARELGYFDIPREASLAEVADECGVSSQAVSERIRRGTATLVDTALRQ